MNTDVSNTDLLKSRIECLNPGKSQKDGKKTCVIYVISRDQYVKGNCALLAAQKRASALKVPMAVVFCFALVSGRRARVYYEKTLSRLEQVEKELSELNIPFMMLIGSPMDRLKGLISHIGPSAIYFELTPLPGQPALQKNIADIAECGVFSVDNHNIMPIRAAGDKQKIGDGTIGPEAEWSRPGSLQEPKQVIKHPYNWPGVVMTISQLDSRIRDFLLELENNGQNDINKQSFS